jgi:hypothetical protein
MIKFVVMLMICLSSHAAYAKSVQGESRQRIVASTASSASEQKQKMDVFEELSSSLLADLDKGTQKCSLIQKAESTKLLKDQIRLLILSHNPDDVHKLWFRVSLIAKLCDEQTNPTRILDFIPPEKR